MPVPTDIAPPAPDRAGIPKDERFPRSHRLLRRSEFIRIQQQGKRVHTAHFVILVMRGPSSAARLGITAGRRVGCAVRRNRIKRVVREVFRRNRELFPDDCDVVLVARPGADRLDYSSVQGELRRAQAAIERVCRQLFGAPEPASNIGEP
jgi:ribonuclease P protein component